jgi:hypothetical protein
MSKVKYPSIYDILRAKRLENKTLSTVVSAPFRTICTTYQNDNPKYQVSLETLPTEPEEENSSTCRMEDVD